MPDFLHPFPPFTYTISSAFSCIFISALTRLMLANSEFLILPAFGKNGTAGGQGRAENSTGHRKSGSNGSKDCRESDRHRCKGCHCGSERIDFCYRRRGLGGCSGDPFNLYYCHVTWFRFRYLFFSISSIIF